MSNADGGEEEEDSSSILVIIVIAIVVVLLCGLIAYAATKPRQTDASGGRHLDNPLYGTGGKAMESMEMQQVTYRRASYELSDGAALHTSSSETSFGSPVYASPDSGAPTAHRKAGLVKVESFC